MQRLSFLCALKTEIFLEYSSLKVTENFMTVISILFVTVEKQSDHSEMPAIGSLSRGV